MDSTSNSGWSLMVTAGGGGGGRSRFGVAAGSLYGRRRETWNTGWILRVSGRASLKATWETRWMIRYGPVKRC